VNVVCNRCSTEYEFDDALVSRRGTTVKCTNCGHQFRVRPDPANTALGDDRWLVRKTDGRTLTFTTMRELQKAIETGIVVGSDLFSRNGQNFRALAEVAELESFLRRHETATDEQERANHGTLSGLQPRKRPSHPSGTGDPMPLASSVPPPAQAPGARAAHAMGDQPPRVHASSTGAQRLLDPASPEQAAIGQAPSSPFDAPTQRSTPPDESKPTALVRELADREPPDLISPGANHATEGLAPTRRRTRRRVGASPAAAQTPLPSAMMGPAPTPEQANGMARARPAEGAAMAGAAPHPAVQALAGDHASTPLRFRPPSQPRHVMADVDELRAASEAMDRQSRHLSTGGSTSQMAPLSVPPPAAHPSGLRWIVGLILVGALALLAGTVGKDYLRRFVSPAGNAEEDQRLNAMLKYGDELYRLGDLEGAKAEFDKASVLSASHPAVLVGLARLEATRADRYWLGLRLLTDSANKADLEAKLERRLAKLEVALRPLRDSKSTDPEALSLVVDGLRLQGKLEEARRSVAELGAQSSEPRIAYVLAALDLAEDAPDWSSVGRRLRAAVAGERGLGRARSALIYALARSGDLQAASTELERLKRSAHPNPLAKDLAAFIARTAEAANGEPTDTSTATTKAGARPKEPAKSRRASTADSKPLLVRATEARSAGNWEQAGALYQQALQENPADLAALNGLAQMARARGNTPAAESHYAAALRVNANYAPALLGLADLKWHNGAQSDAVRLYQRLLSSGGSSDTATRRIAEFEGGNTRQAEPRTAGGQAEGNSNSAVDPTAREHQKQDEHSPTDAPQTTPPEAPAPGAGPERTGSKPEMDLE
jgi:predicted Zn finger-like uncharacterized protein